MNFIFFLKFFSIFLFSTCFCDVYELNDKFLDVYKKDDTRSWLIKFYAPWCHHCRQIENTYNELAELVKQASIQTIVGKIDCTKYTSIATYFGVRGFPTIMYINSKKKIEFLGDRNKEEMLEFVKRLSGPALRKINSCQDLNKLNHNVFFVNFGKKPSLEFQKNADFLQSSNWFYYSDLKCDKFEYESIYSVKKSSQNDVVIKKYTEDQTLIDWIKAERFPKFMHIGLSNINYLLNSKKILAILLTRNTKTKKEIQFFEALENVANTYEESENFIFGWTNHIDVINSIATHTIEPIPNYIFINSTNMNYYLYEGKLDESKIIEILDSFKKSDPILVAHGGNTWFNRIKRISYDGFIAISMMFESNPFLTVILFGLPITFFSIIMYCSCCSDMFENREDYEDLLDEEDIDEEQNSESDEDINKTDHLKTE